MNGAPAIVVIAGKSEAMRGAPGTRGRGLKRKVRGYVWAPGTRGRAYSRNVRGDVWGTWR
jgi:hypothetical protein